MEQSNYWNDYYGTNTNVSAPLIPSQFAAFIVSELKGLNTRVIDFGCGNGRDTLFFARQGYSSLGVDSSEAAVADCQSRADSDPNLDASFICARVDAADLAEKVTSAFKGDADDTTIYARFFIHAIDDNTETAFLKSCAKILNGAGRMVVEFRTNRDQNQQKITPSHYRRFVAPTDFINSAAKAGFKIVYFVEGFGFAKYKDDDAHVARFVLVPAA